MHVSPFKRGQKWHKINRLTSCTKVQSKFLIHSVFIIICWSIYFQKNDLKKETSSPTQQIKRSSFVTQLKWIYLSKEKKESVSNFHDLCQKFRLRRGES